VIDGNLVSATRRFCCGVCTHRNNLKTVDIFSSEVMIKEILVNVECDKSRDSVRDYAISIAETYGAHLAGVVFADYAENPNYVMPGVPSDILAQIATQREKAARDAIARFEAAAGRGDLSIAHRLIGQDAFGSSDTFSSMARRFDLSVIMQSDDEKRANNDTLFHTALFNSGRPDIVVPYIQKAALKLDRIVCCWDGSRPRRAPLMTHCPSSRKHGRLSCSLLMMRKRAGRAWFAELRSAITSRGTT
jgi:hypothetical protein